MPATAVRQAALCLQIYFAVGCMASSYGFNPTKYLRAQRILVGAQLLREGDFPATLELI